MIITHWRYPLLEYDRPTRQARRRKLDFKMISIMNLYLVSCYDLNSLPRPVSFKMLYISFRRDVWQLSRAEDIPIEEVVEDFAVTHNHILMN